MSAEREAAEVLGRLADQWEAIAGQPGGAYVTCARELRAALAAAAGGREAEARAWDLGHAAGRDYQGDGWNSDAHDPADDNPYRTGGSDD